jgi:hypothetical protein
VYAFQSHLLPSTLLSLDPVRFPLASLSSPIGESSLMIRARLTGSACLAAGEKVEQAERLETRGFDFLLNASGNTLFPFPAPFFFLLLLTRIPLPRLF